MRQMVIAGLLLASVSFAGTAEAHWVFAQGNNATIETPTTSACWYKGWGTDCVVGSNQFDWIHIPVQFGDALRANTIFLRFLTGATAKDVLIKSIHVYNGDVKVKAFDNLNYDSITPGAYRELQLSLGNTLYFSRGFSISIGVLGGSSTNAVNRRFVLATVGAHLVQ